MSRLIYVKAYQRRRPGVRHPKWVLVDLDLKAVLTNIRTWRFDRELGHAKVYFKADLKRLAKDHAGEDWEKRYLPLAVR